MCVGETYRVPVECAPNWKNGTEKPRLWGRVIWVHPRGRFAVLEFEGVHSNFRECFFLAQLTKIGRQ